MLDSEKGKWRKSASHACFWLQFDPPGMDDGEEHHDPFQLYSCYYTTDVIRICSTLKFSLITAICWRSIIRRCTYTCIRVRAHTHRGIYGGSSMFHDSNHYQVFKSNRVTARLIFIQQQDKTSPRPPCKSIWLCNCVTVDLMTLPFPTHCPPSPCSRCLPGYISFHFHAEYVTIS